MTDQTRWGIDQVQVKNKAIKYQKDLVSRAMEHVVKMDESGITDLMIEIEAEYERKYGGFGAELLYAPFNKNYNIGFEKGSTIFIKF